MTGCAPDLALDPPGVARSHAPMGRGRKAAPLDPEAARSDLALALAVVLRRRFDAGLARGSKTEFGHLLRAYPDQPIADGTASVAAAKLLAGQLPWPESQWADVAEFVGLTPSGLLREVAAELDRE